MPTKETSLHESAMAPRAALGTDSERSKSSKCRIEILQTRFERQLHVDRLWAAAESLSMSAEQIAHRRPTRFRCAPSSRSCKDSASFHTIQKPVARGTQSDIAEWIHNVLACRSHGRQETLLRAHSLCAVCVGSTVLVKHPLVETGASQLVVSSVWEELSEN